MKILLRMSLFVTRAIDIWRLVFFFSFFYTGLYITQGWYWRMALCLVSRQALVLRRGDISDCVWMTSLDNRDVRGIWSRLLALTPLIYAALTQSGALGLWHSTPRRFAGTADNTAFPGILSSFKAVWGCSPGYLSARKSNGNELSGQRFNHPKTANVFEEQCPCSDKSCRQRSLGTGTRRSLTCVELWPNAQRSLNLEELRTLPRVWSKIRSHFWRCSISSCTSCVKVRLHSVHTGKYFGKLCTLVNTFWKLFLHQWHTYFWKLKHFFEVWNSKDNYFTFGSAVQTERGKLLWLPSVRRPCSRWHSSDLLQIWTIKIPVSGRLWIFW